MRVQRADGGVHRRGLAISGHDQSLAAVRQKILGESVDPARLDTRDAGTCRGSGRGKARCKSREERSDLSALETKTMIRHRSGQRVDPFNGVEPVHHAAGRSRPPTVRKAPRVTDHFRIRQERVGVEGENHRGSIEPELEIDVAARGLLQSREAIFVADGVVGRPPQFWVAGTELSGQSSQRWGGVGLGKEREAGATIRGMRLCQFTPGRHEIGPGLRLALQPDGLRPVGIVKAEHGCLDARARGSECGRVRGVSLDLGRPTLVALDDHTIRAAAERHRRGVVTGNTGDDVFGRVDVRDDVLDGPPDDVATRKPRDRDRGAQERDHVAPGDPLGKLGGTLRELPLEKGSGFGALIELGEASPVGPAQRWHPEQSVGGLTGRSLSSCAVKA